MSESRIYKAEVLFSLKTYKNTFLVATIQNVSEHHKQHKMFCLLFTKSSNLVHSRRLKESMESAETTVTSRLFQSPIVRGRKEYL